MTDDFGDEVTAHELHGALTPIPLPPRDTARLIVLAGPDNGRRMVFTGEAVIGRAAGLSLVLRDTNVSRRHARIWRDRQDQYALEDLGSRNGTLLQGVPIKSASLAFGDRIQVGTTLLLFAHVDAIEDTLAQREKLETMGRLSAGIAHDINNFLGATLACGEFGRDLAAGDTISSAELAEIRECFDDVVAAARRGGAMTQRLLGLVRRSPAESRRVDLSAVVTEAIELARRTFPSGVAVGRAVLADVHVMGDASQLHQVVMNLLINARDAMPEGGRVVVRLGKSDAESSLGEMAVLVVEDSGEGMDAEIRARMFEPFFTTKHPGAVSGTGLGLAGVLDIVRAHAGRIECQSAPAAGTHFVVSLPLAADRDETRATHRSQGPQSRVHETARVLLVEQDVSLRRATARLLRRAGHRVLEATDAGACVQICGGSGDLVDVIVLDLGLPTLDEVVITKLRTLVPLVPLIVVSGACEPSRRARLEHLGVAAVLAKPCGVNELLDAVQLAVAPRTTTVP